MYMMVDMTERNVCSDDGSEAIATMACAIIASHLVGI